jgi:hypothetical protein
MQRKTYSILIAILAAVLLTSTVFAGNIKFSSVTFDLGSLIAKGDLTGLGNDNVKVQLDASGFPLVICTNQGGNQAPGQNPPKVSASGYQDILKVYKNGKSPFDVETEDPPEFVDPIVYGCPNENWTAQIDFIFWTDATISVYDLYTNELLASQDYTCTTTLTSVTCDPVK